jgi:hypothetical protein
VLQRQLILSMLLLAVASPAQASMSAAGDLDPTFSGDGVVQRRFGRMPTSIADVARARHGAILVAANVGCCGG